MKLDTTYIHIDRGINVSHHVGHIGECAMRVSYLRHGVSFLLNFTNHVDLLTIQIDRLVDRDVLVRTVCCHNLNVRLKHGSRVRVSGIGD